MSMVFLSSNFAAAALEWPAGLQACFHLVSTKSRYFDLATINLQDFLLQAGKLAVAVEQYECVSACECAFGV